MCKFPENLKQAVISKSDSPFQSECVIKRGREWEKNHVILTGRVYLWHLWNMSLARTLPWVNEYLWFRQMLGSLFVSQYGKKSNFLRVLRMGQEEFCEGFIPANVTQSKPLPASGLTIPWDWSVQPSQGIFCLFGWFWLVGSDISKGKIWAVMYLLLEMICVVERRQGCFFPSSGWICRLAVGTKPSLCATLANFPWVSLGENKHGAPWILKPFYTVTFRE